LASEILPVCGAVTYFFLTQHKNLSKTPTTLINQRAARFS
jgi:hypothetical protein